MNCFIKLTSTSHLKYRVKSWKFPILILTMLSLLIFHVKDQTVRFCAYLTNYYSRYFNSILLFYSFLFYSIVIYYFLSILFFLGILLQIFSILICKLSYLRASPIHGNVLGQSYGTYKQVWHLPCVQLT